MLLARQLAATRGAASGCNEISLRIPQRAKRLRCPSASGETAHISGKKEGKEEGGVDDRFTLLGRRCRSPLQLQPPPRRPHSRLSPRPPFLRSKAMEICQIADPHPPPPPRPYTSRARVSCLCRVHSGGSCTRISRSLTRADKFLSVCDIDIGGPFIPLSVGGFR